MEKSLTVKKTKTNKFDHPLLFVYWIRLVVGTCCLFAHRHCDFQREVSVHLKTFPISGVNEVHVTD